MKTMTITQAEMTEALDTAIKEINESAAMYEVRKVVAANLPCPHCKFGLLRAIPGDNTLVQCCDCFTIDSSQGDYFFSFPIWARGANNHFKRAFCHIFNIQG